MSAPSESIAGESGIAPGALTRWRNAELVAFALGGVVVAAFGSRLPSIQSSLDVSKAVLGAAITGVTLGALAGLSAAAWIHARFGARRGVGASLVVSALGLGVIGMSADLARSVVGVTTGLVLVGLGTGTLDVLINVEGAALERAAGRTLMPLLHAAWSGGAVIGGALGALSAAVGLAAHLQFALEGAAVVGAAVYVVRGLPAVAVEVDARPAEIGSRRDRFLAWCRTWSSVRLLLIGLVMLGAEFGEGSANSWLTLAARAEHHHSDAVAASYFVLFAVGEMSARLLGSSLVDRFGRVAVVRVTASAGVVGMVVFITTDAWWLTAVGTVLWAIGVSMGFPLGMSAAAESGPNSAARVSVVAAIGYTSSLVGPPVVGLVADRVGLLDALWIVAALLAVAAALAPAVRARVGAIAPSSP
ncbi:MFS transporter [Lapillicoccus jejuensis]|uniref:Fucose permease n=1 Tax=Lapillicoccus jejuensis TaxID=402171 RepID=A0A542DW38_9MICO|nr:MFS transporter [Lapillicoccus jejuensis]TQJ07307.1 fucose permease [Lapillicoccus jejuensis]